MFRLPILLLIITTFTAQGQSILGHWKTVDDVSGKEKSVVEIYERGGKVYGKIKSIFRSPGEDPDPVCDKCPVEDSRHNQKVIGLEIIQQMKKDGDGYSEGNILDPEDGKIYRCKLWLAGNDLKVRGYWGPFYRTQTWKRSTSPNTH